MHAVMRCSDTFDPSERGNPRTMPVLVCPAIAGPTAYEWRELPVDETSCLGRSVSLALFGVMLGPGLTAAAGPTACARREPPAGETVATYTHIASFRECGRLRRGAGSAPLGVGEWLCLTAAAGPTAPAGETVATYAHIASFRECGRLRCGAGSAPLGVRSPASGLGARVGA